MILAAVSPQHTHQALLTGTEIVLFDLLDEHACAQGHPLFAAQLPIDRIATEAASSVPSR